MRKAALALLILLVLAACSGKPPSIANLKWFLVDRPMEDKKSPGQSLSLFAAVQDPDGIEDVQEFYLINDDARLYWKLTKDDWEKKDQDGSRWIGSNGFTLPSGGKFPDGQYRVLIVDSGGDRAEREISINQSARGSPGPASLSLAAGQLSVQGPFPANQLFVLDANGDTVLSLAVKNGSQSYQDLVGAFPEAALGRSLFLLSLSEATNQAVMSKRISLP